MHGPVTQGVRAITGATGRALSRALVAGERAPVQRTRCREARGVRSTAAMAQALTGPDRPEPVCALTPALAVDDTSTAPVRECASDRAQPCHALRPAWPDARPPVERADNRLSPGTHGPSDAARPRREQRTGVDLGAISGLTASTGHTLRSDMGVDRQQWPPAKAFWAWVGWAPRHDISGGPVWRRSPLQPRNRAGRAVRRAAPAGSRRHQS
jgi:transposase